MSFDELPNDTMDEKIKILATDDKKIKSFGEIFTNDSSREILQLLFNEELSANQIAQKTEISLQLVKYHLNKLQDLGVVKISKVEKNSKSQDMKIYSATKFSIVIVPPTLSEKTRESKLLVRSFRHIYKVAGLGIATGISALFSASTLNQNDPVVVDEKMSRQLASIESSMESEWSSDFVESAAPISAKSEPNLVVTATPNSSSYGMDVPPVDYGYVSSDVTVAFTIITIILGGFTAYYIWKAFRR